MQTVDMESLNEFQDIVESTEAISFGPKDSISEILAMTDICPNDHQGYLRLRQAISNLRSRMGSGSDEKTKEAEPRVVRTGDNVYLMTVDRNLLYEISFGAPDVLCKLLQDLATIPTDATLKVIPNLDPIESIGLEMVFDGVAATNLISSAPCKKIFQFSSIVGLPELAIATSCDDVEIGDFAAVSITKAENGDFIMKYVMDTYRHLVRYTYNFWKNKGLFTADEITGLFSSESEHSILLLSDEIKRRIGK